MSKRFDEIGKAFEATKQKQVTDGELIAWQLHELTEVLKELVPANSKPAQVAKKATRKPRVKKVLPVEFVIEDIGNTMLNGN